ncbi:MAG: cobyrinic acid a,c-diamide synthase [Desulfobacteraceae bacterium Eth-SRB1]|nr:MAG: cobyrinic acid a,c-diamide synthase [Desulfobacteraceae bacterium Eth-SRB1]
MKGLVVAGIHSGCGKTTIAMGLMAVLKRRGMNVAPFKVGPDFIDPGFHKQICDRPSRNLDGWMLSKEYNKEVFYKGSHSCDVAIVEGVMGLFDGYDGRSEAGSTAEMAKWLSLPVLLIVDARSMARSAAAMVYGFENFDRELKWAGVVLNRLGSNTHLRYIREAFEGHVDIPLIGGIKKEDGLNLPERHLGLVTQDENPLSPDYIDHLADLIEDSLNLNMLMDNLPELDIPKFFQRQETRQKNSVRIGVARDEAFCFYYQDNFELLEKYGAELVFFSPLRDRSLPPDINGLYLGGGYPELFAEKLSRNKSLMEEIKKLGDNGFPIYAECGGFMYLTEGIEDKSLNYYSMAGIFPVKIMMLDRLKALGYREITLKAFNLLGKPGEKIRGHEFHYSEIKEITGKMDPVVDHNGVTLVYKLSDRPGLKIREEGYMKKNVLGSYVHLHFGSKPQIAENFVRFLDESSLH